MKKCKLSAIGNILLPILYCAVFFIPSMVCAGWEKPFSIVQDSALLPFNNARGIASGQTGALHVVWWTPSSGAPGEIYYKCSTNNGTTWSQEVQLSTNVGGWTDCPAIAARNQYVHVIWEDGDGPIYYNRSTNGGATWIGQTNLSGPTPWAHMPSIAVSGSNVHVVWADRRNGGAVGIWFIYYRHSTDNGATWGSVDSLTCAKTDEYGDPSPSISASDSNVYISWQDFRDLGLSLEIYFRRSTNNGTTWSSDTRLTNGAYSFYFAPRPTLASAGSDVHVVWEETGGDTLLQHLYYIRSTDWGVTWGPWVRLGPDTLWSEQATVTASGSSVHVACMASSSGGIFYRCSTDKGISWSQDTLFLAHPDSIGYDHPSMAISDTIRHLTFGNGNNTEGRAIYYTRNSFPQLGVGSELGQAPLRLRMHYKAIPNPFISFTTIQGYENTRFALYDITGKKAGTFRGDKIGDGLPPGIYFLKPVDGENCTARIVKVK